MLTTRDGLLADARQSNRRWVGRRCGAWRRCAVAYVRRRSGKCQSVVESSRGEGATGGVKLGEESSTAS